MVVKWTISLRIKTFIKKTFRFAACVLEYPPLLDKFGCIDWFMDWCLGWYVGRCALTVLEYVGPSCHCVRRFLGMLCLPAIVYARSSLVWLVFGSRGL
jgi:hypothetical protein